MILRFCKLSCKENVRNFFTNTVKNKMSEASMEHHIRKQKTLHYVTAVGVLTVGLAYAAVPLYRVFCQATSYGGTVSHNTEIVEDMKPVKDRVIRITFTADTVSQMSWNFQPQQKVIKVLPGETALAFYTAKNPTDKPVTGISTYNVVPFDAGKYFNKIQCFCFEEQQLNPYEEVDMPVFFYIDPEFAEDPLLENCNDITLSYTFFEAKKGLILPIPIPQYAKSHNSSELRKKISYQ
ncbi:cytochrome c oxidase assembly protein COX11, mitochondrial [Chelonus insularis]|uniref:cytochrome c oxidase assembly protein COX11, mitochondrial n=1 Tax=Chelonus insularis TaxID=460826 RepID=UPI001589C7AA|nr:cytochrome c oxidase assembly protein COX11, mitochondrial [Chelonus insularis]